MQRLAVRRPPAVEGQPREALMRPTDKMIRRPEDKAARRPDDKEA